MSGTITNVVTTRRCPKCMKDTVVYFSTNEVPRQNAPFTFTCAHCGVSVVDYVEAVAVVDSIPGDAVQGILSDD